MNLRGELRVSRGDVTRLTKELVAAKSKQPSASPTATQLKSKETKAKNRATKAEAQVMALEAQLADKVASSHCSHHDGCL
jgi:hypothetical protein